MLFIQGLKQLTGVLVAGYCWLKVVENDPTFTGKAVLTGRELATTTSIAAAPFTTLVTVSPVSSLPPTSPLVVSFSGFSEGSLSGLSVEPFSGFSAESLSGPSASPIVEATTAPVFPPVLAAFLSVHDAVATYAVAALSFALGALLLVQIPLGSFLTFLIALLNPLKSVVEIVTMGTSSLDVMIFANLLYVVLCCVQSYYSNVREMAVLGWENIHSQKDYNRRVRILRQTRYRSIRPVAFRRSQSHVRCHRVLLQGQRLLRLQSTALEGALEAATVAQRNTDDAIKQSVEAQVNAASIAEERDELERVIAGQEERYVCSPVLLRIIEY